MTTQKIGYIGLGNMGGGIALHLANLGTDLTVFDVFPPAMEHLTAAGAKPASSLAELMTAVDVAIVCVLDSEQLLDVVLSPSGLLRASRPGQVIIVQSTVVPSTIATIAAAAAAVGVDVVDAPVSGNTEDRLNGTLAVIVGGDDDVVDRVMPVLSRIGSPVIHVGPLGAGEVAKLANNAIMLTTRNAAIEIMEFAKAYGVAEDRLIAVCTASSGQSWVLDNWEYFDVHTREGRGADVPQVRESIEAATLRGIDLPLSRAVVELSQTSFDLRTAALSELAG